MDRLIVMVGTNDGKEIVFDHPGDADYFFIYEVSKNGYKLLRKVKNTAKDMEEKHGGRKKMEKVLELVGDIDVILTRRKSPNLIRMAKETTIQPIMVDVVSIDDGLKIISENFESVAKTIERRKEGERFDILKM